MRDAVLAGADALELAQNDNTCKAAAQFQQFTRQLRSAMRAKKAKAKLKLDLTDVVLRDWQEDAVSQLDEYALPCKHELTWEPCASGSRFREMGFNTHHFP